MLDTSKKSDQEVHRSHHPELRGVGPTESMKSGSRKRRYYLLALALALVIGTCSLSWRFAPWRSGDGVNPARGQAPQFTKETPPAFSSVLTKKADNQVQQRPEGKQAAMGNRNQQAVSPALVTKDDNKPAPTSAGSIADELGAWKMRGMPAYRRQHRPGVAAFAPHPSGLPSSADYTREGRPATAAGITDIAKLPESAQAENPDLPSSGTPSDKDGSSGQPVRFYEVPSQIRDSIPISISMLVYSEQPDDRWANINGSKMREGEQIPSGPRVEEITPEGIIFNYRGHSFYKAVRGG